MALLARQQAIVDYIVLGMNENEFNRGLTNGQVLGFNDYQSFLDY